MNDKNKTFKIKNVDGVTTYTNTGSSTFYRHTDLSGEIENNSFDDDSFGTSQ